MLHAVLASVLSAVEPPAPPSPLLDEAHWINGLTDGGEQPLRVFVQVNTSGEESKSGCAPADCPALCRAVRDSCPALTLIGLMCIGKYSASEGGSDVDFACLGQCRVASATALGLGAPSELAMSMGMSHDFEAALAAGATHVRVGSTIFGARAPKQPAAATAPR